MELLNQVHGMFLGEMLWVYAAVTTVLALGFGYKGAPLFLWTILALSVGLGFGLPLWLVGTLFAVLLVFNVRPLRTILVSSVVMKTMQALKLIPHISETERTALDAGVVWIEKDLFSGKPDFGKILKEPYPDLTPDEKAFMDNQVEELCGLCDDWDIFHNRRIPKEVFDYLAKEKFFGMIIPKKYGGLEFSALAHSAVIQKLASRCLPVTITTMVPNSLGPAELLTHYGTDEQKDHYLPRLADGREIPCFALTEPRAGSDAGSIQAEGVLFKEDGELKIRLNWNKRWITLAAIATTLGMAFRLRDPENLLGKGEDVGITCALIPADTKGVVVGRRHDPLGVPFYNCPTQGHDVVIPASQIIGGTEMAGKGWGMLMESLGAGRGISLPAQSAGGAKLITRVVSAHASIRKQFGLPIGKFEGVEEPLARIAGSNYLLEAMRTFVLGALDKGVQPPVVTAMAKHYSTELARQGINDGMDIMGGAGISLGPRNLLAHYYTAAPISITVEGANILTRTLIIFGQGALRAHPFAYQEVKAVQENNLGDFDKAFWGHIGHIVQNAFRSVLLSLTRGRLYMSPVSGPTSRYYKKLAWASASFAIMADISMGALGGKLKVKERITGRFADILSYLFIGTSILRRFEADGRRKEDLPLVHYSMQFCLNQIQTAFDGIFDNLKVPGLGWFFNGILRLWSRFNSIEAQIGDKLIGEVASLTLEEGEQRNRLTDGIYIPQDRNQQMGRLEWAFKVVKSAEESERKIKKAIRKKQLPKKRIYEVVDEALEKNIITKAEHEMLKQSSEARWEAIQVDDFSEDEFRNVPEGEPLSSLKGGNSGGSASGSSGADGGNVSMSASSRK